MMNLLENCNRKTIYDSAIVFYDINSENRKSVVGQRDFCLPHPLHHDTPEKVLELI